VSISDPAGPATPLAALPLSLLDIAPVGADSTTTDALRTTIALAQRADELGFTRVWVAEHHGMPGIASSAPAVLISAIAGATSRIRVGSGGVMLPNHAPLVIAEQFGTLAALYPERIDLGLGRAPGTDPRTAAALRRSAGQLSAEDFPQQLGELASFLAGEFPPGHPYERVGAVPHATHVPPIWLLGSSDYSAQLAGLLSLPFAFAHHFSGENTLAALEIYRSVFRPSEGLPEPYAMVTAQVVCAETDDEARRLALPAALSFVRLRQGRPGPVPTVEQAQAHDWTPAEWQFVTERWANQAIGSRETVTQQLGNLLKATEASELMITVSAHGQADRIRSLELTRELFGPEPLPLGLATANQLAFPRTGAGETVTR
jgi:luciferase family oxidoreductase group 1